MAQADGIQGRGKFDDETGAIRDVLRNHSVCRLTYTGSPDQWDLAIFKDSDDRYDPTQWLFPGADHVDGTLPGALSAALAAYP
jgi:hypothetical protein